VGRAKQHLRVAVEDSLRAVAVVDILVDDGDALQSKLVEGVTRCHRNIVDQTEAHRAVGGGVAPRRSNEGESVVTFAAQNRLDGARRGAGGQGGRFPRCVGRIGVEVDLTAALFTKALNGIEISLVMDVRRIRLVVLPLGR
jgi:hypothetical protein